MFEVTELYEKGYNHDDMEKVATACGHKCVMCDRNTGLVYHEVVPEALKDHGKTRELDEITVLLCRVCATKVETMADSRTRPILERGVWSAARRLAESDNNPFYDWLGIGRRASHMYRFGAEFLQKSESIAEHQYWVAMLSLQIARHYVAPRGVKVDEGELLKLALFHDFPEIITTDVPNPIKHVSERTANFYEKVEADVIQSVSEQFVIPELSGLLDDFNNDDGGPEGRIVRAADKISGIVYISEEVQGGNRNASFVLKRYYESLNRMLELRPPTHSEDLGTWDLQWGWYHELFSDVRTFLEKCGINDCI